MQVKESGGFEWFGASPAHEALTAYGLLLFLDMQKVPHAAPTALALTHTQPGV